MIEDFVKKKDRDAPFDFWFILTGITNQLSTKDAGKWLLTTYNYDKETDQYYIVDNEESSFSFVAKPGEISPVGDIEVSDPTNYADNVLYSFNYRGASLVPS